MKRPTHRDIARIAKVSHVTVSLALRGHPKISKPTRERVEAIAKQIGYRPDPALSALMLYRRGAKPSSYQGTLAWINNYEHPEDLKKNFPHYYLGARDRCMELGYQMEEFRLRDLDHRFGRLSKILRTRNIQGLLFPPQESGHRHITKANFDWENYSSIAFGFSLIRPRFHLVTNAQFSSTRLAVRKLRVLGYRRIGFIVEGEFNERSDQNFLGGFLVEQHRFLAADRIPVHHIPKRDGAEQKKGFHKWFFRHKPDAILCMSWLIIPWFRLLDATARGRCGFALMDVPDGSTEFAGINQNNRQIGRTAVQAVIDMIHANERGIPSIPRRILIEGRWVDGKTAPPIIH